MKESKHLLGRNRRKYENIENHQKKLAYENVILGKKLACSMKRRERGRMSENSSGRTSERSGFDSPHTANSVNRSGEFDNSLEISQGRPN